MGDDKQDHESGEGDAPRGPIGERYTRWKPGRIRFSKRRDQGLIAALLFRLYGLRLPRIRPSIIKFLRHYQGHHYEQYSKTLRKIFQVYHGIDVGLYTHGGCFVPNALPSGTRVGRYCSFAVTATAHSVNHPMNLRSSHAFFFNPALGYSGADIASHNRLTVGNDVWFGYNSIILPSCSSIGDGAVIAAGAVVNKNIPPYAVVVGNPARVVRYRFSKEIIEELLESRWWDRPIEELAPDIDAFQEPLEGGEVR